jgi:hypothetical protein
VAESRRILPYPFAINTDPDVRTVRIFLSLEITREETMMIEKIVVGVLLAALAVNGIVMYCCLVIAGETDKHLLGKDKRKELEQHE